MYSCAAPNQCCRYLWIYWMRHMYESSCRCGCRRRMVDDDASSFAGTWPRRCRRHRRYWHCCLRSLVPADDDNDDFDLIQIRVDCWSLLCNFATAFGRRRKGCRERDFAQCEDGNGLGGYDRIPFRPWQLAAPLLPQKVRRRCSIPLLVGCSVRGGAPRSFFIQPASKPASKQGIASGCHFRDTRNRYKKI